MAFPALPCKFLKPHQIERGEVDVLLGDASKAQQRLGWRHRTTFDALVKEMVAADLAAVKRHYELRGRGRSWGGAE